MGGDITAIGLTNIRYLTFAGNIAYWDNLVVRAYSAAPAATAFGPEREVVTPSDVYLIYDVAPAPLTLAAYVDAYEYLSWTRRYRRPGRGNARSTATSRRLKEFVPGRLVHFRRNGEDRLGLIETRQISVDVSGRPRRSGRWRAGGPRHPRRPALPSRSQHRDGV